MMTMTLDKYMKILPTEPNLPLAIQPGVTEFAVLDVETLAVYIESYVSIVDNSGDGAFNTNAIVYDNSPWRPGRDTNVVERAINDEEDERKFKNLATRIMSNGVEVLVKDKNSNGKNEQRKVKFIHLTTVDEPTHHVSSSPTKSLLSSAVATVVKRQQLSALFPLQNLMQHNYIIKTCMTTYTYLTTVIQNKRSAVSTFETIVSVVTTESLTNAYASDLLGDIKPTKTKYMEVKTIQPSTPMNMFHSIAPKIDKRVDSEEQSDSFDLIQPSEVGQVPCTGSCPCTNTKTEGLSTKYTKNPSDQLKYGETKIIRPTNIQLDKKTNYGPYEFENNSQSAPTDKVVEKYTEVMNDYSDEKDSGSIENELLTNEKAPILTNLNKTINTKTDKNKTEKPQKQNKNKLVVAELIKLGSLGIKGLSQLAPVIEKMTGGFIKRQDINKTTTTVKPVTKLTPYNMNKRVDTDLDSKHSNFPIYIPMNELETAESNIVLTNATLHQNLAWAAEHKQPKSHIAPLKFVHESPLVNGGIPISPGEIITANSDVIVGKPAVGGPLTLAASGIKMRNPVNSPPVDSFSSGSEPYVVKELPSRSEHTLLHTKVDDSYDLRPPELPKFAIKSNKNLSRPPIPSYDHNSIPTKRMPVRPRPPSQTFNEQSLKIDSLKNVGTVIGNHGRPAFLDYVPSLVNPTTQKSVLSNSQQKYKDKHDIDIIDNSPSSSEILNTQVTKEGDYINYSQGETINKPFLVDIQPSKVANVLIPHGSSTALVFAGSSEPHKTGDYVDDPLPYPEPGYFGSFSIDAPQMTNVHITSENKQYSTSSTVMSDESTALKDQPVKKDYVLKWKDPKHSIDFGKLPPPTSNQETHFLVGPQITIYNPDVYRPGYGDVQKFNQGKGQNQDRQKDFKDVIDKEYENYLSVPPPPRSHFQDNSFDNNKPFNQRPIIHTKPIQDMKVFLNVQHPIPKDQLPPKITSEIYFASQVPNEKSTPTYTIRMPPLPPAHGNIYTKSQGNNKQTHISHNNQHTINKHDSFALTSNTAGNKPVAVNSVNENTYSVTLNTATNVASNIGSSDSAIGSSIPISISSSNLGQMNTDIPISTNFAIKVEDDSSHYDNYDDKNAEISSNFDKNSDYSFGNRVSDNRWNTTSIITGIPNPSDKNTYTQYHKENTPVVVTTENNFILSSINSHANFPMINEQTSSSHSSQGIVKPVTETILDDIKQTDPKRPPKVIVNIPTNSHGWYSNVPFDNINNIQVDATTRKVIPLIHDYNTGNIADYGEKVTSVGKPPKEFWPQNIPPVLTTIGKPFTKQKDHNDYSNVPKTSTQSYVPSYIPSSLGGVKQPVYDIPVRDDSDETTTSKSIKPTTGKIKPVYENSEEVYDGNDNIDNDELEGAVSLESMKVHVVSTSNEKDSTMSNKTTQHKVRNPPKGFSKNKNTQSGDFDHGTQTEKPFQSYKKTTFQSNNIKPIYNNVSHTKPRPFDMMPLDHQLQQPHWQINQLLENSTNASYEDGFDLNIGEEMKTSSPTKTQQSNVTISRFTEDNKYKKPPRPIFSVNPNKNQLNDTNIITSIVHIQDKKPLIVEVTEKATLPTFTINNLYLNHTSSDIVDLSPPPPTMDYNFKPSTNDEMIMGMSPPPPVMRPHVPLRSTTTKPASSVRTSSPYKTKPQRTLAPRIPTHRPTRKPSKEDVSTYRPTFNLSNIKRPIYNRDQPSSHLLPPPKELPSRIMNSITEITPTVTSIYSAPKIVFPTPISSGWLTSSGVNFPSNFNFDKTSVYFPETPKPSITPVLSGTSSADNSYSYEDEISPEYSEQASSEKSTNVEENISVSKEILSSTELSSARPPLSEETDINDSIPNESSHETIETTDKSKTSSVLNNNRLHKPYPIKIDDKKVTSKNRIPEKPTNIIKPTRTFTRPEILYPTRHTSTKKIIRPIPSKSTNVIPASIIESSESSIDDNFIKTTKLLGNIPPSTMIASTTFVEQIPGSVVTPSLEDEITNVIATHHAGNEVKISDEVIPTKTEFRTTIVTLTKTLSEPPTTVSSIGYVNLTHTLTVTHTMTSLISQSEGAITQTFVLTNTQTSTVVDVVTEIQTQVQPTTIIETVTKHVPIPQVEATPVQKIATKTKIVLDDVTLSSEESDNFIIKESETTENIQKIETENVTENDNDTFFVVMNKSQSGGKSPPISTDIETGDYDITRNEQVNNNGVSQVLYGEILLAGAPYLETYHPTGITFSKECQPDCKASRNERCQRIQGVMKCVCRPGFARTFPDRPCKPTYTYSVKLALSSQGNDKLEFRESLSDNSSKEYHALAQAAHEGINRMVMQSDLRDVYHGVHITGFHPVELTSGTGENYQGVMNDFYVQLSDNAHESRLKEVIEKYLRTNNNSLGGTNVHAAGELMDKLDVSDFDECLNPQFHDCSEHAQCFNLRGTYTCSCLEGFADLSVNTLYPGRVCSAEPVGCERCNYHGACYSRDDKRVLCECFQWYTGSTCHINLKVVLISLVVIGALLTLVLAACAVLACSRRPRAPAPPRSIAACIQGMPGLPQGAMPSKQRADRRALINERPESGDASSLQNASLPYMPAKRPSSSSVKKCVMSDPPAHEAPPPPPSVMIPRARLHQHHESRENIARKRSLELSNEEKLISYLESGAIKVSDEMRRKHSMESSYSANKDRHNKQGALVSAGFKVSTTIRPDEQEERDDLSSVHKADIEAELTRFDSLRKSYSQEELSEWTDAERRLGEHTLSEARSVGGTLPASTGRAASSTRLTHQDANTMAERDLGSTFLLPHVHLYKPDITSDVSEFDSL